MTTSYSTTLSVDQTREQAFDAIVDVRGWWFGEIEGSTDTIGAEFTYRVPGIHFSRMRVTELERGMKLGWLVVDSDLEFLQDPQEWTGTTVTFEIFEREGRTQIRFTHLGLVPDYECYDACSNAWASYVNGSLRDLIEARSAA